MCFLHPMLWFFVMGSWWLSLADITVEARGPEEEAEQLLSAWILPTQKLQLRQSHCSRPQEYSERNPGVSAPRCSGHTQSAPSVRQAVGHPQFVAGMAAECNLGCSWL